jgi:hypothetical protein
MTMRAYKARFERGRIVPLGNPVIPEGSEIILTILDASIPERVIRQRAALAQLREEMQNCDETVPDFERVAFREVVV